MSHLLRPSHLGYPESRRSLMSESRMPRRPNPEELQRVLEGFSGATGLATVAVDTQGVPVTQLCAFTEFCRAMRSDPLRSKACHGCDAHGGLQALLEGTPQVYRCHAGLVDFSIPLTDGDAYVGAILCGQVRMSEHEMPEPLLAQSDWHGDPHLEELYNKVPVVSRRRLEAAAATLLGLHNIVDLAIHNKLGLGDVGAVGGDESSKRALSLVPPARSTAADERSPETQRHNPTEVITAAIRREDLRSAFLEAVTVLDAAYAHGVLDQVREGRTRLDEMILAAAKVCSPRIVVQLRQLMVRERQRGDLDRYEAQLAAERFICMVLDEYQRQHPRRHREIGDLLNDIARHPEQAISLTEAANSLHWSPGHLSKLFKSVTGCTFVSYVTGRRVERAKLMLASTQMPVQKISAELDFSQVNYFSRVFRASTGMSPSEYRRHCLSREERHAGAAVPGSNKGRLRA
ncbi:helix-turn-helix domain-containing protein [Propionibacterium australiense]|nr:helix-turn-helix domain-containing protein [Propionibacterium australiense]